MSCMYISEPAAVIRRTGRRLVVERDEEKILQIPIHRLQRLVLFGRTQLTADSLALLLDCNIAVSMLTRRGRFRSTLISPFDFNIYLY